MRQNKKIFYDIFNEFNQINKYRELKSIVHHGTNRLDHITRVSKMSFFISKRLGLDYISCTRGAMMHDFFTEEDINYLFDSIIPISIEFFSFKSNNLFKSEGNTLLKRLNKLPYLKEIKLKGIILDNCWKEYNNFKNITKIESICFNFNNPIKKRKIKKILNHL